MMWFKLIEIIIAVLGVWDIARRLIPFRVPVFLAEIACVGIALVLLKWAGPVTVLALCVPGGIMVLSTVVKPGPHVPWGPRALEAIRIYRHRHRVGMRESRLSGRGVGQRIPPL
jgi:hypothetical protein